MPRRRRPEDKIDSYWMNCLPITPAQVEFSRSYGGK